MMDMGFSQWHPVTGNWHKLEHRRLHLSIRESLFTVRVTKHRLLTEAVESPSLESLIPGDIKKGLGMILSSA